MKIAKYVFTAIALCIVFASPIFADGDIHNGGRLPPYQCDLPAAQCPPCDPAVNTCPVATGNRSADSNDEGESSPETFELIWKYLFG